MNTETVSVENLAVKAWVEQRRVFVELCDERMISFPASRFRKLKEAPDNLLEKVQIEVDGYALRWEEIDEDISVPGIVAGNFELPPA